MNNVYILFVIPEDVDEIMVELTAIGAYSSFDLAIANAKSLQSALNKSPFTMEIHRNEEHGTWYIDIATNDVLTTPYAIAMLEIDLPAA